MIGRCERVASVRASVTNRSQRGPGRLEIWLRGRATSGTCSYGARQPDPASLDELALSAAALTAPEFLNNKCGARPHLGRAAWTLVYSHGADILNAFDSLMTRSTCSYHPCEAYSSEWR